MRLAKALFGAFLVCVAAVALAGLGINLINLAAGFLGDWVVALIIVPFFAALAADFYEEG